MNDHRQTSVSVSNDSVTGLSTVSVITVARLSLRTMPLLRSLVAGLLPQRPGSIHVGLFVDKVALGQVFLQVLWFSRQYIIPLSLSKLISSGERVIC
jgi:hypothetical protein